MKKNILITLSIVFVIFSWNLFRSVKYHIMKKEFASTTCYYTTGSQMQQFSREHWVMSVDMDQTDYILIKYLW